VSLIWHIYWPLFAAGFIIGVLAGRKAFCGPKVRGAEATLASAPPQEDATRRRRKMLLLGVAGLLAAVAVWHWPAGAGQRFAGTVEGMAREEIRGLEMPEITVRAERAPLSRGLVLSGPANDLQQSEFVKMMERLPGVAHAGWEGQSTRAFRIPLFVEVALLSLVTFSLGLFFSYIVEVRRRVNAEWSW